MIFNFFQAAFAFLLVLAPLVLIHEFGHFLAAKMFRIGVPVFSLGFGPRLFGFRRQETDYRVSLIPLGGYVRLAGDEADENRTGAEHEFLSRPRWQRFVVFVAGAVFNIVLAFLVLWLLFVVYGKQEVPEVYPTIVAVEQDSPADEAGIRRGDRLITVAGRDAKKFEELREALIEEIELKAESTVEVEIERDGERRTLEMGTGRDPRDGSGHPGWLYSWEGGEPAVIEEVVSGDRADETGLLAGDTILSAGDQDRISHIELRLLILDSPERPIPLRVARGDGILELTVVPRFEEGKGGQIGVFFRPQQARYRKLGVREAALESLHTNVELSKTLFIILKRLVTTEVSLKTMSGPIGIAQYARQALITGPDALLYLLGFFSLQLGILNLLPIPVLDGGHILILGVEGVMRRDLSEKLKERVMQAGFVFLLAFMGIIILQDVIKSF